MWYEIDFKRLAILFLPIRLRRLAMVGWVQALLAPLTDLHYRFKEKRDQDWFVLNHNGQVCYLRAALNAEFDPAEKRIEIVDGIIHEQPYIYTRPELKPRYLGTMYLYDRATYAELGPDFIVLVPTNLNYDEYQMKATIDQYRLATKIYKIETK